MAGSSCSRRFVIGVLFVRTKKDLLFQSNAQVTNLRERGGAYEIYANLIFAADGSESVLYVEDKLAFSNFCDINNPIVSADAKFQPGSKYDGDYQSVYGSLISQKYSPSIANSYALAYVLDKYKTGIKISTRSNKYELFKQQKTELSTTNNTFTPTKCQ